MTILFLVGTGIVVGQFWVQGMRAAAFDSKVCRRTMPAEGEGLYQGKTLVGPIEGFLGKALAAAGGRQGLKPGAFIDANGTAKAVP